MFKTKTATKSNPYFNHSKNKAFTLLELIVVVVVLGILAALAIPTFNTVKQKSIDSTALRSAESIARAANMIAGYDGRVTTDADIDAAAAELTTGTYATETNTVTINSNGKNGNAYVEIDGGIAVASQGVGTATSTPGLYYYTNGVGFPSSLKLYVGGSGLDMGKMNEPISETSSPGLYTHLASTSPSWTVTLSDGLNVALFNYNVNYGSTSVTLDPVGMDQAEIDAEFLGNLRTINAISVNIVTNEMQINVG